VIKILGATDIWHINKGLILRAELAAFEYDCRHTGRNNGQEMQRIEKAKEADQEVEGRGEERDEKVEHRSR
jgi:hypothetical protein